MAQKAPTVVYFLDDASPYLLSNFCCRDGGKKVAKMHSNKSSLKKNKEAYAKHTSTPKKSERGNCQLQHKNIYTHFIVFFGRTATVTALKVGECQRKCTDHEGIGGVDNVRVATGFDPLYLGYCLSHGLYPGRDLKKKTERGRFRRTGACFVAQRDIKM